MRAQANPEYLHFLAQNLFFDDPEFKRYLVYLQYFRELPYCLFITFPHCLRMLELLVQDDGFCDALKRADFKDHVFQQQYNHWRYRNTLLGDVEHLAAAEREGGAGGETAEPAEASSTSGVDAVPVQ